MVERIVVTELSGLDVKSPRTAMKPEFGRRTENLDFRRIGAARTRPGYSRLLSGTVIDTTEKETDDFESYTIGDKIGDQADWTVYGATADTDTIEVVAGTYSPQAVSMPAPPGSGGAAYSSGTLSVDQYAEFDYDTIIQSFGPMVRATSSGAYYLSTIGTAAAIYRITGWDPLTFVGITSSVTIAPVDEDTIRLEVIGNTIRALLNGTVFITATDSVRTSGRPGFYYDWGLFGIIAGGDSKLDNFAAGNVFLSGVEVKGDEEPSRLYSFERDDNKVKVIVAAADKVHQFDAGKAEWS